MDASREIGKYSLQYKPRSKSELFADRHLNGIAEYLHIGKKS